MIGTPGIRWCDCRWRFLVNGPISPLNRPLFKFIHFCMRADTQAFLKMKKFDIDALKRAYEGK